MMKTVALLPPGFRFHPTDEELIIHYLRNQASCSNSKPCPVPIIPEVNNLISTSSTHGNYLKSEMLEGEWYFFTPRDRKYPNGARPNRATLSGYWKATGTDKPIYSNSRYVGLKKALVFYRGRPPKGSKTGWIMHEYRLAAATSSSVSTTSSTRSSKVLDEWVLCRIYQKKHQARDRNIIEGVMAAVDTNHECSDPSDQEETLQVTDTDTAAAAAAAASDHLCEFEEKVHHVFPRSFSLAHLLEPADYLSASLLFDDYSTFFNSIEELFENKVGNTATAATLFSTYPINPS